MSAHMNHDEAFADLDAVAFDLLDRPEREAVLAHVDQCPKCRAELDERRAIVADLAFAAPLAADTADGSRSRIKSRLAARADADLQARHMKTPPLVFPTVPESAKAVPGQKVTTPRGAQWMAIAAGILLVASIGLFASAARDRNELRKALNDGATQTAQALHTSDSLSRQLARRDSLIAGLTGRDVSVMTLTSGAAKEPYARMFWDRVRHSWTLIAHNLPALKVGRTYQLWLLTSKAKISAGTFGVENGEAVVLANYNLTEPLNAIAVTEEPAGGVPQPTGDVVIAAAAAK